MNTVDTVQKAFEEVISQTVDRWDVAMVRTARREALRYEDADKLAHVVRNAVHPRKYTWVGDYYDRTITGCTAAVERAVEDEAIRLGLRMVDPVDQVKLEMKMTQRHASRVDAENERLKKELKKERGLNHSHVIRSYENRYENSLSEAKLQSEIAELKAQLASGTATEGEADKAREAAKGRVEQCQEEYDRFLETYDRFLESRCH